MDFHTFATLVHEQFNKITKRGEVFHIDATRDDLWATYLAAFPEGTDPIFRERTEHDCSTCRQFIKGVGGIVVLDNNDNYQTIWDVQAEGHYGVVADKMAEFVRCGSIDRVYRTREHTYGAEATTEFAPSLSEGPNLTWHHFHCRLPPRLVVEDVGAVRGQLASTHQVLGRGLQELTLAALETVEDLIGSNSLYRGEEHLRAVRGFRLLKQRYDDTPQDKQANLVWANLHESSARFRNTAIGTLVQDLSEGMDIAAAVRRFESKVAPHSYRRSSAPITKGMIDKALLTLRELGLEDSVHRRFATIADVSPNDVLFVDRSVRPHMKDGLADLLMEEAKPVIRTKKDAVDIDADQFFSEVVTGAEDIEVQLGREHLGNFVSLTAPKLADTGRLFQWRNDFAWVYDGNVTDSIKARVKAAGGNIDALMRVSLSWFNGDDLDIHCKNPRGSHISWQSKQGILDVDMNAGGPSSRTPVENLAFNRPDMPDGLHKIWVHQYARRESIDVGFEIEYEHKGDVRHVSYPRAVRQGQKVQVCTIKVRRGEVVDLTFAPEMTEGGSSTEKWGVTTGQMVPVETIMLSPNHWGPEEERKGNRHHIFTLRDCKNPDPARGFFNEYLRGDLHQHRKVFEVLGGKLKCEPADDQLSGVGFSSTRHDRATFAVRKDGTIRTYNVQF